jgi:hypothetical protein
MSEIDADLAVLFRTAGGRTSSLCSIRERILPVEDDPLGGVLSMFRLVATMRRGSGSGLAAASARYPTIEAARVGTATLLRDDRILRVMIVRNEVPPAFVEWVDR